MVCHSLLQWTTFCQNSSLSPIYLGWPCTAWIIVSLGYTSSFATTKLWYVKGHNCSSVKSVTCGILFLPLISPILNPFLLKTPWFVSVIYTELWWHGPFFCIWSHSMLTLKCHYFYSTNGENEPEKSNFSLSHKVGRWRSWGFKFRSPNSRGCAQKHYTPQPVSDSCSTLNVWFTFERKFKSSKKLPESSANFSFYSSLLYAYRLWTDWEMLILQYFRLSQNKVRSLLSWEVKASFKF